MEKKTNKVFFSIIIPIYNTQEHLEKCIDSCVNQSFNIESYEIILINDGSTDKSQIAIDKYVQEYENIQCIIQENQGLSQTRNNGIEIARGQYIWFVDSDDWVESYSLEKLYKICINNHPDIIAFGAKNFVADMITRERPITIKGKKMYSGVDLIEMNTFQTCSTFYLYSRDFLKRNDLNFYPDIYHEDAEFIPRALFEAESVYLLDQNLYCVNEREGSITRSYIPKKSEDLLIVADNLIEFFYKKNSVTPRLLASMNARITTALNSSLHNSNCNVEDLTSIISKISGNKMYIHCFLGSRSFKHKVEGVLLNFPKLFMCVYSMLIANAK
nr:glycosyltransferase [uncultured Sphaerochaeta sp.]